MLFLGAQLIQSRSKSLCSLVLKFLVVFVHLDLTLEHQNEAQEAHGVLFLIKEDNTTNDQETINLTRDVKNMHSSFATS